MLFFLNNNFYIFSLITLCIKLHEQENFLKNLKSLKTTISSNGTAIQRQIQTYFYKYISDEGCSF